MLRILIIREGLRAIISNSNTYGLEKESLTAKYVQEGFNYTHINKGLYIILSS